MLLFHTILQASCQVLWKVWECWKDFSVRTLLDIISSAVTFCFQGREGVSGNTAPHVRKVLKLHIVFSWLERGGELNFSILLANHVSVHSCFDSKFYFKFIWVIRMTVSACFRSWDWQRFWQFGDWLCSQSIPETAAVLLCHPGVRSVWGYGAVLLDDGLPPSLCLLTRASIRCRKTKSPSFVWVWLHDCTVCRNSRAQNSSESTHMERKDASAGIVKLD